MLAMPRAKTKENSFPVPRATVRPLKLAPKFIHIFIVTGPREK